MIPAILSVFLFSATGNGSTLFGSIFGTNFAYATDIPMSVSISETLSVSLSNTDGSSYDGNVALRLDPDSNSLSTKGLDITVGTNHASGYTMTVTSANDATSLTDSNTDYTFPTIDSTAPDYPTGGYTPTTFPSNYWGYKAKVGTASESNYLPFVSGTILDQTNTRSNEKTTTFTFGAKANYQAKPGAYELAITFNVVANPTAMSISDLTYMQDFANLGVQDKADVLASMDYNTDYTLKDKRDEQDYTIARLTGTVSDSGYEQVWMTKNLNLAGGTALNSTTTDMPSDYTLPTANGFQTGNKLPNSSTSGFSSDTTAYVYNTGKSTGTDCSSPGCYSYYSWTAATLGSGLSESGNGTDVTTASICPKGWRLPKSGNETSGDANSWKKGDFYKMATAYGANLESNYYQNSGTFYTNAGPSTTVPNFLLAGDYYSGSFYDGGSGGCYWSSSSRSSTDAYDLYFNSSSVNSADYGYRRYGFSVRCVLAD